MQFLLKIYSKYRANLVARDEFANEYYEHKKKNRRWVVYNGKIESTKVPAEWQCWLCYATDVRGNINHKQRYSWQETHLPNLTGTKYVDIYNE